jgi:hypothetical protein
MSGNSHWTDDLNIDTEQTQEDLKTLLNTLDDRVATLEDEYESVITDLKESKSVDDAIRLEGIIREYIETLKRRNTISETISAIEVVSDKDYWNMVGFREIATDNQTEQLINEIDAELVEEKQSTDAGLQDIELGESLDKALLQVHSDGLLSDEAGTATGQIIDHIVEDDEPHTLDEVAAEHFPEEIDEFDLEQIQESL